MPVGILVTLEPLPFANAEGPLQVLPAAHTHSSQLQAANQPADASVPGHLAGGHAHSISKGTAPGDPKHMVQMLMPLLTLKA